MQDNLDYITTNKTIDFKSEKTIDFNIFSSFKPYFNRPEHKSEQDLSTKYNLENTQALEKTQDNDFGKIANAMKMHAVFFKAIEENNLEVVRAMLFSKENPINPNFADQLGNTPLMKAAAKPDAGPMLDLLLEAGADINQKNGMGENALLIAYKQGALSNGKKLLTNNADPNVTDHNGISVLMAIAKTGSFADYNFAKDRGMQPKLHHFGPALYQMCVNTSKKKLQDGSEAVESSMMIMPSTIIQNHADLDFRSVLGQDFSVALKQFQSGADMDVQKENVKKYGVAF